MIAVLSGAPAAEAAPHAGVTAQRLSTAVAAYRAAGRAALHERAAGEPWTSVAVSVPERGLAERCATTVMLPVLTRAEAAGVLASWWFVRKSPQWRWRLGAHPGRADELRRDLTDSLAGLAAQHPGITWCWRRYEPETFAFGGAAGMEMAHRFFHADSRAVLGHLTQRLCPGITARFGDREASLLVCTALLRGAGLDWHEQGDVWAHVTEIRPTTVGENPARLGIAGLTGKVRRFLQLDTRALRDTSSDHESELGSWLAAAAHAGAGLRELADDGRLRRGLRAVLAHHVVFHWNRLGLPTTTQTVLAHAATTAVLGPHDDLPQPGGPR